MRRLGVYVTVARGADGSVHVDLAEPDRLTRLHIHAEDGGDAALLTRALFESGAAVQSRNADYLISVDWLQQHYPTADVTPDDRWLHVLTSACGDDGYVSAVDAIRARVYGPWPDLDDPDCVPPAALGSS
jgi:hypothetical protein